MSFFGKHNPTATPRTVALKVVKYCVIATTCWLVAAWFKPDIWSERWVSLPLLLGAAALSGAVIEWQVPKDQDWSKW